MSWLGLHRFDQEQHRWAGVVEVVGQVRDFLVALVEDTHPIGIRLANLCVGGLATGYLLPQQLNRCGPCTLDVQVWPLVDEGSGLTWFRPRGQNGHRHSLDPTVRARAQRNRDRLGGPNPFPSIN